MMQVKICHITTVHSEKDVRIFQKMCVSLASNPNFNVSLIVPNTLSRRECGVEILSFTSKVENRKTRIKTAGKIALEIAKQVSADIYHLHDPELLRIALKLKSKTGAKVIFDSHEDVPKQLLDKIWIPTYQRKVLSWIYSKYERYVCSRIDGIISVTETICSRFRKIQKNVELIANYPDLNELNFSEKKNDFSNSICYVGGIFKTRGIIELVHAIEDTNIELLLAGTFESDELKQQVMNLPGWKNVKFFGQVERKVIKEILEKSEIGVVTLHPTKSYLESYPIKLFEYMAAGIAILASDFPLWRKITAQAQCSCFVNPENVTEIRLALMNMMANQEDTRQKGMNGNLAVKKYYNWENEYQKLCSFYLNLIDK